VTLWQEINEQPETLRRVVSDNTAAATTIARHIRNAAPTSIVIAARGTSDNAARYAQYVWGARNRFNVALTTPSLFSLYKSPPDLDGALVVALSQSGESPDLVAVLDEARTQQRLTLAITNRPDSPLAEAADLCLEIGAGEERSIAATKTYTAQLAAVALLSVALDGDRGSLDGVQSDVETVLADSDRIAEAASMFVDTDAAAVLGRGFNHSTAFEWALKLQELTYVLAHPFSAADFVHGPLALVSSGFPVLAVAPTGVPHKRVHSLLERLTTVLGSRLAAISNDERTLALADAPISIPPGSEWLTPIVAAVAAQVFTYHLAVTKGLDPDSPRTINKVTKTM
jgi:glutamine---fructose-6-phosphate transaminase (isomerizing)